MGPKGSKPARAQDAKKEEWKQNPKLIKIRWKSRLNSQRDIISIYE